jgi:Arc/MetJ-type ribon-helix-helix transcriptional regulator
MVIGGYMPDSEKLTINLSVVDLGQIDLLVDEGFYANRSDFIRTAIRTQLNLHTEALKQAIVRKSMAIGVIKYNRADLEKLLASGERLAIRVIGLVVLDEDIPTELAVNTIDSLSVKGVLRCSSEVRNALAHRITTD